MRTCWKAGRAAISCTLGAASEEHNSVSLLEKMPEEASEAQLLCWFFSLAEVVTWLCSPALALLYFFQTSLSIYHKQINLTLWLPACRTMLCKNPAQSE